MLTDKINISLGDAGIITLFSMLIVFAALLVISYAIDVMRICISKSKSGKKADKKVEVKPIEPVVQTIQEQDDTELVAVITAAIAAMTGSSTNGLVVKNIKRIPDLDSAWAKSGKIELMR